MMQWEVLVVDGNLWLRHYYIFMLRSKHYLLLKVNYAQVVKSEG
jgi:hypothetical protein